MARLRLSRARYQYQCGGCSKAIRKGQEYYRVEPHPMARMHRGEKVQHLCLVCVHGQEYLDEQKEKTRDWLRYYWVRDLSQSIQYEQLPFPLEEPVTFVKTRVYVANITPEILRVLLANPNEIYKLKPEVFERLICDRLQEMGFGVELVGGHTYRKDGGIDIVAWPLKTAFPFLMAVQAKHHRSPKRKTGPGPVRELLGVLQSLPFHAGVLVTNTTFSPGAKWAAEQRPKLIWLRDIHDIRRWLENNFLDEYDWREMPNEIVVCPGVTVRIPKLGAFD